MWKASTSPGPKSKTGAATVPTYQGLRGPPSTPGAPRLRSMGARFRALRTAAHKEAEEVAKEKAKKKAEEDMHKDIEARLWWDAVFERWWQRVKNGTAKVGMGPYNKERARMQGIDVPKLRLPPLIDNA